jgi:hypothetical protein
MKSFIFWQSWLLVTSLLFALWGMLMACCPDNILFHPYNKALCQALWQQDYFPDEAKPLHYFLAGPLGGTITACYLFAAYISAVPFREKKKWARSAILVAFGSWAIIDSTVSLFCKVYFQVYVLNAISILIKALPLIFTWKEFDDKKEILS